MARREPSCRAATALAKSSFWKLPEEMQSTRNQTTSGSSEPHAPQYKTEEATRNNDAPGPEEEQQKLEPTPSSQAAARKDEHLEDIRSSHEDLSELTEENLAEYSGLLVAQLRAAESKRDDAIINDPYAETLAGDAGAALLSFFSKWSPSASQLGDYIALRTRSIDEALIHRRDDVHQVVILGAGLDSRAYRMKALSDCHVIEVDSNQSLVERKQKLLDEAGAYVLAKQHHVVVADLTQDMWQTGLISKGFNPKEPTFWVLEGLLYYMNQDSNVRLVKTLDALSAPNSQLWADISGFALMKGGSDESEGLFRTRALKYGENDPREGVLAMLKWKMEVTPLDGTGPTKLYGRGLQPMKWRSTASEEEEVVPWFFVTATKPHDTSDPPLL